MIRKLVDEIKENKSGEAFIPDNMVREISPPNGGGQELYTWLTKENPNHDIGVTKDREESGFRVYWRLKKD